MKAEHYMTIAFITALALIVLVVGVGSAALTPTIRFPSGRTYYEQGNGTSAGGDYVPYTGATANVNIGGFDFTSHNLYTSYIGGTVGSLDMSIDPWAFIANLSVKGDINPQSTLAYSLGSGAKRWKELYVANISSEYINTYGITVSENSVFEKNVTIVGELMGGSPVKIRGGLQLLADGIQNCDLKTDVNGTTYCGQDATGSGTANDSVSKYINFTGVPYASITGHPATASGTAFAAYNRTSVTIIQNLTVSKNVLSLPLTGGKTVVIECFFSVWSINATNTVMVNITYTGTSSRNTLVEYYTSTTAQALLNSSAASYLVAATSGAGLVQVPMKINGYSIQSGPGFFTVGVQAEIAGSRAAVNQGSWCRSVEIS